LRAVLFKLSACMGIIGAISGFAQTFTPISTPGGTYTSSTAVMPITPANNTIMNSITDGTQTITFSTPLTVHTVPGGGWATWGSPPNTESATPKVLGTYTSITTATLTLAVPSSTFGFEIEPDTFSTFSITATFMNGSTVLGSVTRSVNGSAGALLAAAASTPAITSVVLTVPAGANGFAIAQIRYAAASPSISAVPAPALGLPGLCALGIALLAAGSLLARSQSSSSRIF
jgi:hypothetical protein